MRTRQQGFTLIELIIITVILVIIATIAAPNMTTMLHNNRAKALGDEFVAALNTARTEAVRRGLQVSLCASSNGTTCNSSDWTDGWLVFLVNQNGNNEVVRVWAGNDLPSNAAITSSRDRIDFLGTGMLPRADTAGMTTTVSVTGCQGNAARQVRVGPAGMVAVTRVNCG